MEDLDVMRSELAYAINTGKKAVEGQEWDLQALQQEFEVIQFAAPVVIVRRKSDNKLGTVFFRHHPRIYFDFKPHED